MFCALTMASASVELELAGELAAEERERYAMHAAGLESYVAQRTFLQDLMLPQRYPPTTYERMYTVRHNALIDTHDSMVTVYRLLRRGQVDDAMQEVWNVVGDVDGEDSEEESLETDDVLPAGVSGRLPEDVQQALLAQLTEPVAAPAPAAPAFMGRSFRLDD